MGRKLEFNHERAVERATGVFWAKGYSGSSMRDLLKAMRIGEGSFYHMFGSKNRLYLECLRQYNDTVTRRRLDALRAEPSVGKALRNFFRGLLDDMDNPKRPHVCLMSRSLSPDVLDQRELECPVRSGMELFEQSLSTRLQQAKEAGELSSEFQTDLAAQIIFTFLQGYFRVVKVLKSREEMWKQIDKLLTSLGL
jgi:TetR/AcrR family transcriptional repressor of nem operon